MDVTPILTSRKVDGGFKKEKHIIKKTSQWSFSEGYV